MRNPKKPLWAALPALAAAALCGCDTQDVRDTVPDVPSKSEIDDAKARVGFSSDALGRLHAALEMLGIIPVYTCGEPRAAFAGKLPDSFQSGFVGATVALDGSDPAIDRFTLSFPPQGGTVRGQKVTGTLLVKASGGQDRFTLEMDATQAQFNGTAIQTIGGYGTCGDSTTYWAESEGPLAGAAGTYALDARVGKKAGLPLIGSTTLVFNATGNYTRSGKKDALTLTGVDYQVGKVLPRKGTIRIETSDGHTLSATFSDDTPLVGQVKVKVDSKSAVTIPLPGF